MNSLALLYYGGKTFPSGRGLREAVHGVQFTPRHRSTALWADGAPAVEAAPAASVKQKVDDGREKMLAGGTRRETQNRVAANVRDFFAKLPLSKMKIVIDEYHEC